MCVCACVLEKKIRKMDARRDNWSDVGNVNWIVRLNVNIASILVRSHVMADRVLHAMNSYPSSVAVVIWSSASNVLNTGNCRSPIENIDYHAVYYYFIFLNSSNFRFFFCFSVRVRYVCDVCVSVYIVTCVICVCYVLGDLISLLLLLFHFEDHLLLLFFLIQVVFAYVCVLFVYAQKKGVPCDKMLANCSHRCPVVCHRGRVKKKKNGKMKKKLCDPWLHTHFCSSLSLSVFSPDTFQKKLKT